MTGFINRITRRIAYALGFGELYSRYPNRAPVIMIAVAVALLVVLILIIRAVRKKKKTNAAGATEQHLSDTGKQQATSGPQGTVPQQMPAQMVKNQQVSQSIESSAAFDDICDLDDLLETIRDLAELKDAGILTEDEFEQKKKEILQRM